MILIDANLLIYAFIENYPEHAAARRWLDDRLNSTESIGIPWPALVAFVRVVTNPRIFRGGPDVATAWRQVSDWLVQDNAWVPTPTERHADVLGALLVAPGMHGRLIDDAHLAALAIEHGLELCSCDGDFARFRGLRWRNPIA